MEELTNFINMYSNYIILTVSGLFIIAFITFFIVLLKLNKTRKMYKSLIEGMENKNLEEIILNNSSRIKKLEEILEDNNNKVNEIEKILSKCLKNVSIERYNAFEGIGGEQSFSLALLDDSDTGFVITCIHGRDDARTYAKPIIKGSSKYNLSEEEKRVIKKASKNYKD